MDEIQSLSFRKIPGRLRQAETLQPDVQEISRLKRNSSDPDPAVLQQLADSARSIMESTPEVCLITSDWEPQIPVLSIEYDQPTARALGLSRNDVSISLLSATSGIPIGSFYEGIHKNTYLPEMPG